MRVDNPQITVDATQTNNGAAISIEHMLGFSAIATSVAAQVGTLKFQVSNDSANTLAQTPSAAVWVDLPSASFTINGVASQALQVADCYYKWIRPVYTRTGGAGTIALQINCKGA